MIQLNKKRFTMAAVLFASIMATTASADVYLHIDQMALDIQTNAGLLLTETRHYRHTSEYRHMRDDAQALRRLAAHVHDVVHNHGSVYHLQSDLAELDRVFHHLEAMLDSIERDASRGFGGHIHGSTEHVKELLCAIEDCLHQMQTDVRKLRRGRCGWTGRNGWEPPYGDFGSGRYGDYPSGNSTDVHGGLGYPEGVYFDRSYGANGGLSVNLGAKNFQIRF